MDKEEPLKPGVLEDRFARLALANCRSLLRAADALASIPACGHALSLVSLGLEEMETAHAYRLVADGIATFDPKEAHVLQFIDKHALLMHTPKSTLLGERVLTFFYMRKTAGVIRQLRGYKPTPEQVVSVMTGSDPELSPEVKKVLDSPEVVTEGRAVKEDLHRLNRLKNLGLYVIERGGRLTAPSDITEKEFRHFRVIACQLLEVFEESTENGFPFAVAESMRRSYAAYRKVHKRLEGPLNPRRIGDEDTTRSDYDYDPLAEGIDGRGDPSQ